MGSFTTKDTKGAKGEEEKDEGGRMKDVTESS